MTGVNKVILIGHLGHDPSMRATQNGTVTANFTLATSEKFKGETRTEWHKIVVWGNLAEICGQYLKKGSLVYLEGRIQTREWTDKDGQKRTTTEIVASEMRMLGGKEERPAAKPSTEPPAATGRWSDHGPAVDDEQIPF
jgi:single-strand DNA-binding protein